MLRSFTKKVRGFGSQHTRWLTALSAAKGDCWYLKHTHKRWLGVAWGQPRCSAVASGASLVWEGAWDRKGHRLASAQRLLKQKEGQAGKHRRMKGTDNKLNDGRLRAGRRGLSVLTSGPAAAARQLLTSTEYSAQ